MPEIRLGGGENLKNVNLGSTEIQEVYLGAVLVWQNNLGPIIEQIVFNGITLNADADGIIDGVGTAFAGVYNGSTFTYNFSFNDIEDPDYTQQVIDGVPAAERDYVVGYRIQRPDDTWFVGDPDSPDVDAVTGLPEGEFGAPVNTLLRYNSVTELFDVNGAVPDGALDLNFPVTFTDLDGAMVPAIVDAEDVPFKDKGVWKFHMVDSRGGQTEMAHIDITLSYQDPAGSSSGGGEGFTKGVTQTISFNTTGGPHTIRWQSGASASGPFSNFGDNTEATLSVTPSPFSAPVYYSPLLTGRLSEENAAPVFTTNPTGIFVNYDTFSVKNVTLSTGSVEWTGTTPIGGCVGGVDPPASCACNTATCSGVSGLQQVTRTGVSREDQQGNRCVNSRTNGIVSDTNCPAYANTDGPVTIPLANFNTNVGCGGGTISNPVYEDIDDLRAGFTPLSIEGGLPSGSFIRSAGPVQRLTDIRITYNTPAVSCNLHTSFIADTNAMVSATCGTCSGMGGVQMTAGFTDQGEKMGGSLISLWEGGVVGTHCLYTQAEIDAKIPCSYTIG